jgi:hypothetical protein
VATDFVRLLLILSVSAGCGVALSDTPNLLCDAQRPCSHGRTCIDEHCLAPEALTACDEPELRSSPNLATNATFEAGISGWEPYALATVSQVEGGFQGQRSLQVAGGNDLSTFGVNDSPTLVSHAVTKPYCFSGWVRSPSNAGRVLLRVREYNASGTFLVEHATAQLALSPTWQRLDVTLTPSVSDAFLDFQILDQTPASPGEAFWIDAVSVRQHP